MDKVIYFNPQNYKKNKLLNRSSNSKIYYDCKLESILNARNITLNEFSELCGIDEVTLQRFISCNDYNFNIKDLSTMMNILGIENLDDFIEIY